MPRARRRAGLEMIGKRPGDRIPAGEWLAIPAGGRGPSPASGSRGARTATSSASACGSPASGRGGDPTRRVFLALGSLVSRSRGIEPRGGLVGLRDGGLRPGRGANDRVPLRVADVFGDAAPGSKRSAAMSSKGGARVGEALTTDRALRKCWYVGSRPARTTSASTEPRASDPRIVGIRPRLARRHARSATGSTPRGASG